MIDKARQVLAKCEADLRELLTRAAAAGDYDAVVQITVWAKEVATITGDGPKAGRLPAAPAQAAVAPPTKRKGKGKVKDYPQFERRGTNLVKIGWSKRERAEYEHKAPWAAAKSIAKALGKLGADGRVFQVPELLPLTDPNQQIEVPHYQVYLMFAWLRTIKLLDQHGRQGYSIPKPSSLEADMDTAWKALPTKH